jgi:NADH-quinone oxidoreductase subunit K
VRPVIPYVTAALLFGLGVYGVLRRRNAILLLMSVELMLNAVNLILVTATVPLSHGLTPVGDTARAALPHGGQVFALFVIVIAAAEVGVGLAIVLQLYRMRASVAVDEVSLDSRPADDDGRVAGDGGGAVGADPPTEARTP